jgi:glycerophosphoryl diester phosphodiesterase
MSTRRIDPIFERETPLLFAHRGGKLEVPESTPLGFDHARDVARADVLEIDVQRTVDGTIVVWHGPSLENVRIGGIEDRPARRDDCHNDITKVHWRVLDGNAWVSDPRKKYEDLSDVPEEPSRRILRLTEFLELYPNDPVNIEIKTENFEEAHVVKLLEEIRAGRGVRPILVVSQSDSLLEAYHRLAGEQYPEEPYPTGLSTREALAALARSSLPLIGLKPMAGRALQTTHHGFLTPEAFIRDVKEAEGAAHVFITGFLKLPALDAEEGHPTMEDLLPVLCRGVDGIMTDRPEQVRPLLDDWKKTHPLS